MTESDAAGQDRAGETDGILTDWSDEVRAALGIEADVDIRSVLGLAGVVAHSVVRPAAPLTTYLVGFAAGRAAERGDGGADRAAYAGRDRRDHADRSAVVQPGARRADLRRQGAGMAGVDGGAGPVRFLKTKSGSSGSSGCASGRGNVHSGNGVHIVHFSRPGRLRARPGDGLSKTRGEEA